MAQSHRYLLDGIKRLPKIGGAVEQVEPRNGPQIRYYLEMTRSELVFRLAERFPQYVQKDIELAVFEILDAMHGALVTGARVEIRGFGSFALNYRPPRTARNPKTGEPVTVAGKWVPHFKAGKEMRERVAVVADSQPNRLVA